MGLKAIPMRAETGPIGGDLSHEFIILAETGESEVFCHRDYLDIDGAGRRRRFRRRRRPAADRRPLDLALRRDRRHARRRPPSRRIAPTTRSSARGIEVGHIFYFGTKYSAPMKAVVATGEGGEVPVHMGSYGIGAERLVGRHHRGVPRRRRHRLAGGGGAVQGRRSSISSRAQPRRDAACGELYRDAHRQGVEVLYDDRDERAGAKFATMDLIGIPWQVLVGPKGLAEGKVEVKNRAAGEPRDHEPGGGAGFADAVAGIRGARPRARRTRINLCACKAFRP